MQSNVVISILSGCGLWFTYSLICQRYEKFRNALYYILLATAVAIGAHQIVSFSEKMLICLVRLTTVNDYVLRSLFMDNHI